MTDNVFKIVPKTKQEEDKVTVEEVLEVAKEAGYEDVILVGITPDGEMGIQASSMTREEAYFYLGIAQNHALMG